jgi:hypothetical protein
MRQLVALWDGAWRSFRPYLQLLYLNHGYKYFAPEPGPSTLLAYTMEFADASSRQETIPNRDIHPRLLYHRHFMLTEFLNFGPDDWHRSYARHLCRTYGAEKVTLSLPRIDTSGERLPGGPPPTVEVRAFDDPDAPTGTAR